MSYDKTKRIMVQKPSIVIKETLADIEKYPFVDVPERGITKATCERFGVRAGLSEKDGKTVEYYYFPSYNKKGKVTGYKRQDIKLSKEVEGHWVTVGSVGISNKLFGQYQAEQVGRKRANVTLTEGEWDCMSVVQACVDSVKNTKYAGLEPFVVSIPLGTSNAVESVLHNEEFVKSFDSITFFLDDDYCTPAETKKGIVKGHEAREAVSNALVGSGLSMFTVTPAYGFKDASDYLQAGKAADLAKAVQFDRRAYSAEKIVKASDISFEELIADRPEGIYVDCFPALMKKLHGFRTRELITLCAPSNVGKSTITSIFASAFMKAGEKVGMIFLEETNKETLQRMVAGKLKVNYSKFKDKPLECASEAEIKQAYEEICNNDQLTMLGHFGSISINDLMPKLKHMHLVEGCRYIILDHLAMLVSALNVDDRKQMDITMTELAAFCAANDCCVVAVSHINRTNADQFRAPKGKDGKENTEPYWVQVTKESMRSSAALEQLSWTVIGLEPQIMPDRSRGNVRLTVLKNRTFGALGICDEFCLDDRTGDVMLAKQHIDGF